MTVITQRQQNMKRVFVAFLLLAALFLVPMPLSACGAGLSGQARLRYGRR